MPVPPVASPNYTRYAIVAARDLEEGVAKLANLAEPTERTALPFKR